MRLLVFTDLHHYAGDLTCAEFDTQKKLSQYAMPMLDRLIDIANNEMRPNAVINLGDSIQDANAYEADVCSLSQVAQKVKKFQATYYMVLGNHDLKMFDSFDEHQRIFGFECFNYSVDIEGYHLVFMTNGIVPERGRQSSIERSRLAVKETVSWLRDDLRNNEKPCIVFTHYPLLGDQDIAPRHLLENADELFDIFDRHPNVLAVISGHTHKAYRLERNAVHYHALGSPIACFERNGIPDAVYYLLEISGNDVTVSERKLPVDY